MKNTVLIALSLLLITNCNQNQQDIKGAVKPNKITFEVNEGTEFLLTAFNLAIGDEVPEDYKPCETSYTKSLNAYFLPHKEHPFIKYINLNRELNRI